MGDVADCLVLDLVAFTPCGAQQGAVVGLFLDAASGSANVHGALFWAAHGNETTKHMENQILQLMKTRSRLPLELIKRNYRIIKRLCSPQH